MLLVRLLFLYSHSMYIPLSSILPSPTQMFLYRKLPVQSSPQPPLAVSRLFQFLQESFELATKRKRKIQNEKRSRIFTDKPQVLNEREDSDNDSLSFKFNEDMGMNDNEPVPHAFRQIPTTQKQQPSSDSIQSQRSSLKNPTQKRSRVKQQLSKGKMRSKSLYEWHLTLGHRDINVIKRMKKEN
jgi:hypothetical protein